MKKKFADFINKIKLFASNAKASLPAAIYWTLGCFAFFFLSCLVLWDFNLFLSTHWDVLSQKILWGFRGFSFMIFLSAMPVIWLMILIQVLRAKKFPFSFNKPVKKTESEKTAEAVEEAVSEPKLPSGIPEELKEPYLRMARGHLTRGAVDVPPAPAAAMPVENESVVPAQTPEQPAEIFPLPDDFSESISEPEVPVFKEISFGKPAPKPKADNEIEIVVKDAEKLAIYNHSDSDFWIADEDSWFAGGKQTESPIKRLLAAAESENAVPVLHLASTNIMDLATKRSEWEALGIRITED